MSDTEADGDTIEHSESIATTLVERAEDARDSAESRAPLSGYNVGAAIRGDNGVITTGGNIENDNYSNTLHAEECALVKAVEDPTFDHITHIAVATSGAADSVPLEDRTAPNPCGKCKQTLSQFMADEEILFFAALGDGEYEVRLLEQQFQLPDEYEDE